MEWMAKDPLQKQIWVTSGVIGASIIAASVGFYFLSNAINAQAQKILTDKAIGAEQAAAVGVLAKLKSDATLATQYANAMNTLVPIHDNLIGVPQWLNTVAASHGVTISFSFQGGNAPASGAKPGTDPFTLTVDGTSDGIAAFMGDIESQAPEFLLNVTSFDLTNNGSPYHLSVQGVFFSRASS